MDAVSFAINSVMNGDIPTRILEDAFLDRRDRYRRSPISIEEAIREKVWNKRVRNDLNALGGVYVDINLAGLPYEILPNYDRIVRIPLHRTNNRPMLEALRVTLNVTANYAERNPGQTPNWSSYSPVEQSVRRVIRSNRPIPLIGNAHVELLSDNCIRFSDVQSFRGDVTLTARCEVSDDFSSLGRPYLPDLAELMEAATKMVIYRELDLAIDQAKLDGGRELGKYRERIDDYRDAAQTYKDLLNSKWSKILILGDQQRNDTHILRAGRTRY